MRFYVFSNQESQLVPLTQQTMTSYLLHILAAPKRMLQSLRQVSFQKSKHLQKPYFLLPTSTESLTKMVTGFGLDTNQQQRMMSLLSESNAQTASFTKAEKSVQLSRFQ